MAVIFKKNRTVPKLHKVLAVFFVQIFARMINLVDTTQNVTYYFVWSIKITIIMCCFVTIMIQSIIRAKQNI